MYKRDISESLGRLSLTSGGAVEQLLKRIRAAEPKLMAALAVFATGTEQNTRSANSNVHTALTPINEHLASVSLVATGVELHGLGERFDQIMSEQPALESMLRPGRQAVAELAGAYDVALSQNRTPSSVIALVRPASDLALCYEHYDGIRKALAPLESVTGTDSISIEIDGVTRLDMLAKCIALLSLLAHAVENGLNLLDGSSDRNYEVQLQGIESGSPIQFILRGNGKALRFLLAMLRDAVRAVYLNLTPQGRTIQAMETLAYAKELGIDSPEALGYLQDAVIQSSRQYSDVLKSAGVVVNGKRVEQNTPALPAPKMDQLPPPKDH